MNKKGSGVGLIIFAIIIAGVLGYFVLTNKQNNSNGEIPSGWQLINAEVFAISLPPGWQFHKLQGTDSYVGEFVGDGATLRFDYGWYSQAPEIDYKSNQSQSVTKEIINNREAQIVLPATLANAPDCQIDHDCPSATWPCDENSGKCLGRRTTGVYFGGLDSEGRSSLWIYGDNLSSKNQETALRIFRTIRIKESQ